MRLTLLPRLGHCCSTSLTRSSFRWLFGSKSGKIAATTLTPPYTRATVPTLSESATYGVAKAARRLREGWGRRDLHASLRWRVLDSDRVGGAVAVSL